MSLRGRMGSSARLKLREDPNNLAKNRLGLSKSELLLRGDGVPDLELARDSRGEPTGVFLLEGTGDEGKDRDDADQGAPGENRGGDRGARRDRGDPEDRGEPEDRGDPKDS